MVQKTETVYYNTIEIADENQIKKLPNTDSTIDYLCAAGMRT